MAMRGLKTSVWVSVAALSCALFSLASACSATDSASGTAATTGSGASGGTDNAGGTSSGGSGGLAIDAGQTDGGDAASDDCDDSVDIVFVMDVSTSMGPFLNKLAQEITAVDQAIQQLNLNAPPQYGLVVFVDDTSWSNNGQPYTDLNQLKADFQSWASSTSFNQQTSGTGYNSTWPENSLDGLYRAAAEFAWRPATDTLRMVIHTTDDTFWNGPTTQDGVQIQHSYSETVAKLQEQKVRVFSFAAKLGGSCECEDVTAGWFSPWTGIPAIPTATGGGAWDIDQVLANQISLSDALPQAVEQSRCKPYPTPS